MDNPASERWVPEPASGSNGCPPQERLLLHKQESEDINPGTTAASWGSALFLVGNHGISVHV